MAVIDYDASTGKFLDPGPPPDAADPFEGASDEQLLEDPRFHAQNVYAIAMCTLARFEYALGRRVAWSFQGHQLKIAPHAFCEANAFYSERDEALLFGYFPSPARPKKTIFSCLSYDVVAHETAHALLDGLRTRLTDASWPDQLGFHEGFADVVALLSLFAQRSVVVALLERTGKKTVAQQALSPRALRESVLLSMAEQMGEEIQSMRGKPLRRSASLGPSTGYRNDPAFREPHRRGEILAAAMLGAFVEVWSNRLKALKDRADGRVDVERAAEEGAAVADHLVTIAIRGLDYAPPVDLRFEEFLSAMLTADAELHADDRKYTFRPTLLKAFGAFGIIPLGEGPEGTWQREEDGFSYERCHLEPLLRDRDEVFRFLWENRQALRIYPDAFCRVQSVRPVMRQGPDGMFLRETVAEYVETLILDASQLKRIGVKAPAGMLASQRVHLYGGGALVFNEFGRLKFHVHKRLDDGAWQSDRLAYLFDEGFFEARQKRGGRLAELHVRRAVGAGFP